MELLSKEGYSKGKSCISFLLETEFQRPVSSTKLFSIHGINRTNGYYKNYEATHIFAQLIGNKQANSNYIWCMQVGGLINFNVKLSKQQMKQLKLIFEWTMPIIEGRLLFWSYVKSRFNLIKGASMILRGQT